MTHLLWTSVASISSVISAASEIADCERDAERSRSSPCTEAESSLSSSLTGMGIGWLTEGNVTAAAPVIAASVSAAVLIWTGLAERVIGENSGVVE